MLLLDLNNEPQNTVYYLSGLIYGVLSRYKGLDFKQLYAKLNETEEKEINFDFFSLALDFLFLIDKVKLDEKGGLNVIKKLKN